MFQALQMMQKQMADQTQILAAQMQEQMSQAEERARQDRDAQNQAIESQNLAMQTLAEKIGGTPEVTNNHDGGGNKRQAKGRHPAPPPFCLPG